MCRFCYAGSRLGCDCKEQSGLGAHVVVTSSVAYTMTSVRSLIIHASRAWTLLSSDHHHPKHYYQNPHTMPLPLGIVEEIKRIIPPLNGTLHKGQSGKFNADVDVSKY